MKKQIAFILAFFALFTLITSCSRKKIYINVLPPNTPKGAQIFVAGNFNNWNPGDPNYLLKFDATTKKYWVDLPLGFGKIEYKFTRGDWTTAETDSCGGDFGNRSFTTTGATDWIQNSIASWHDLEPINCSRMVLVIDSIPANSPQNAPVFLIGNINNWTLANLNNKFTKSKNGKYYLTVFKQRNSLEFKINRGFNETVEVNEYGIESNIRVLDFGKKDTVHLNIFAWLDLPLKNGTKHTFIIEKIPSNTPKNADIFLAGDFNFWNPYDKNFAFTKITNGKYALTITFNDKKVHDFKITRGGWDFEEADNNFNPLQNRKVNLLKQDTSYISVANWFDKAPSYKEVMKQRAINSEILLPGIMEVLKPEPPIITEKIEIKDKARKIVFIINVPSYTDKYDKIYLTGDFNDWTPDDDRYMFRRLPNGKYTYTLRLKDNNAHNFKITNGGWENEEANYGMEKGDNRHFKCCSELDTVSFRVVNWLNYNPKRKVVFIIEKLPKTTNESIYLTGNFNNWNEKDEQFKFLNYGDNKRILYLPHFDKNYREFKITKGNWDKEFTDKKGNTYGDLPFKNYIKNDTIRFEIFNWKN